MGDNEEIFQEMSEKNSRSFISVNVYLLNFLSFRYLKYQKTIFWTFFIFCVKNVSKFPTHNFPQIIKLNINANVKNLI